MAISKMLTDEATTAYSTQALNHSCFGTGPFPLLFPNPVKTLTTGIGLVVL